ncbi:hypothetical protein F4Y59_13680 [Candidatus Poribacteria bacterium]|nr:hypothetical protein [Candidatus Poribacteria bacterium]MYK17155.1 hypothetical protein [Candidatus Poribacteria bacterium]
MREMRTWRECLIEDLADRQEAIHYLQAILDDYYSLGHAGIVRDALTTVVDAQGGISTLTQDTDMSPKTLADALSNGDIPLIDAIGTVLNALGYQLLIQPLMDENSNLTPTKDTIGTPNTTLHLPEDSGTQSHTPNG